MNITPEQVILIGLVATVVVQLIKLAVTYFGLNVKREVLTVILFVLAIGLALVWAFPAFPALPVYAADPAMFAGAVLTWMGQILTIASVILGFATLIYNLLLDKVFEALGFSKDKITAGK